MRIMLMTVALLAEKLLRLLRAVLPKQQVLSGPQEVHMHAAVASFRSDQITLHLFQPHQADQMLTLLTQEGSSFLSTC